MTVEQILLAVLARADDPNSGARQMPNHWGWPEGNVITGSSPIATQLPHAAGLAYAAKLRGEDRVVVSYFGEGATSKGDFHEALNFAGIHQLPMVFVCENNGYAISVPMSSESAVDDVADRAHSYGFGGVIVDGNDPLDVYAAVHSAVRHARRGDGPTLVECKTYRYLAHTSDDDDRTYRTPQEVEAWRKKDPLRRITQYLIEQRLLSEADEERIEAEVKAEVDAAAKRAEAAAAPDPATAYTQGVRPAAAADAGSSGRRQRRRRGRPSPPEMPEATTERNVVDTVRWTQQRLMATDDRVMILGEDVGPARRRVPGHRRAGGRVRRRPRRRHPAGRELDHRHRHRAGPGRPAAHRRDPVRRLHPLRVRPARVGGGPHPLPLERRLRRAPRGPGAVGRRRARRALPLAVDRGDLRPHPRPQGGRAVDARRRVRDAPRAPSRTPTRCCSSSTRRPTGSSTGPVPDDDAWRVPIGLAEVARAGRRPHRGHLRPAPSPLPRGRPGRSPTRTARRSRSSTCAPSARSTATPCWPRSRRTGRCLVVHEDNVSFGVGAEVAAIVAAEAFWDLDAPVRRLATADVPSYPFAGAARGRAVRRHRPRSSRRCARASAE